MSPHPAACSVGTGGYFPGAKAAVDVKLTAHFLLVKKCFSVVNLRIGHAVMTTNVTISDFHR
jgi:hypothetical protein